LTGREPFNGGGRSLIYKGTWKLGVHLEVVALKQPVIAGKKDSLKAAILKVRHESFSRSLDAHLQPT
jgi:hypothetical protein